MTFKTKEDLLKVENPYGLNSTQHFIGFQKGVKRAFESFAERFEFYKRYKNNPMEIVSHNWHGVSGLTLLSSEKPGVFEKYFETQNRVEYNDWLFDYCFGDVMK